MFSVIFTFGDFQLIYALTHGGPANATHVFSTLAFDIGMSAGQLGMGAAIALSILPALAALIIILTSTCGGNRRWSAGATSSHGCGGSTCRWRRSSCSGLFPFYWMLITSIKPNRELYSQKVMPLVVHQPTLKHYIDLLTETNFLTWTYNTLLVAVVTTVVSVCSAR